MVARRRFLRIMPIIKGQQPKDAGVVKLVYTTDSKSVAFGRGGSSPPTGTIFKQQSLDESRGFVVSGTYSLSGMVSTLLSYDNG